MNRAAIPLLAPRAPRSSRAALAAKLNPPASSSSQVLRPAVLDRMASTPSAKLILVRAPAGFGKTTLMLQCRNRLEAQGVATSWLTLDGGDNDAARFVRCLAAAVANITQEQADIPTLTCDEEENISFGDLALEVTDRLAMLASPFALFLDDFERIHEPAVLGLVREIIEYLPRHGQLVIGSRTLPDLSVGRLRARGQLLELDAELLRFSLAETTEFITQRRQVPLLVDDLARLHRKTEGWITALWLASIALERHEERGEFITGFSGSNRAIAEYLAQDVLDRQPPQMRAFMLRTSILRQLSPELCDAICSRHNSAQLLEQLERSNMFLTPIVGNEKTWRYHSLFADFLRSRLEREMPDELPRLHRAASHWYEVQQRPVPAIDHAIEGGDTERAFELLSDYAESLLSQGRMRLVVRWFDALPADAVARLPMLQIMHMWALCFTRGAWESMALLEQSGCRESDDPDIKAHVDSLLPTLLGIMDRFEEAEILGSQGLARLPTTSVFADTVLTNSMANTYSVMGKYQEASRMLEAARRTQGENVSAFNIMYSESVEGCIDLRAGRMRQAMARFRLAVGATHRTSYSHTTGNAWAGVLYAGALYEVNDLEQATRLLHVYVPLVRDVGLADHILLGYIMLSRIAFSRGDVDQAFQLLSELEYIGHERQLPRVVNTAKLERARVLLLQGNHQASREELVRADDPAMWQRVRGLRLLGNDLEYIEMGRLRWEIIAGKPELAIPSLTEEIAASQTAGHNRRALKLRLLQALAFHRSGQEATAHEILGEVLPAAGAEGFVRLILDEGVALGALIGRFEIVTRDHTSRQRDPIYSDYLMRLVQAFGPAATDAEPAPAPTPAEVDLVEPLTRKEIRVLQLLAEGYSNSAMAEKLFVSDSTVRTHLRNINSKLNVHSRTRAVAVARSLGVIR